MDSEKDLETDPKTAPMKPLGRGQPIDLDAPVQPIRVSGKEDVGSKNPSTRPDDQADAARIKGNIEQERKANRKPVRLPKRGAGR